MSVTLIFLDSIGRRPSLLFDAISSVGRQPAEEPAAAAVPAARRTVRREAGDAAAASRWTAPVRLRWTTLAVAAAVAAIGAVGYVQYPDRDVARQRDGGEGSDVAQRARRMSTSRST